MELKRVIYTYIWLKWSKNSWDLRKKLRKSRRVTGFFIWFSITSESMWASESPCCLHRDQIPVKTQVYNAGLRFLESVPLLSAQPLWIIPLRATAGKFISGWTVSLCTCAYVDGGMPILKTLMLRELEMDPQISQLGRVNYALKEQFAPNLHSCLQWNNEFNFVHKITGILAYTSLAKICLVFKIETDR